MDNPGHYDEYPELTRSDEERERAKKADTTMNTGAASLSDETIEQECPKCGALCLVDDGNYVAIESLPEEAGETLHDNAADVRNALVSLECVRQWLDGGCDPKAAVVEINGIMRMLQGDAPTDAAIAAGGAQEAVRLDTGPNLEGLRERLLTPRAIERTSDGWLYHPDYPTCDEGTRADKFLEAFGIETAFVGMESDAPDLAERWHEEGLTNCSEWTPTTPGGDGWLLLEIYDTEDGPYALFGRDHYAAEQARKKEHTRRLSEAVRRARLDRAAASNGEQA